MNSVVLDTSVIVKSVFKPLRSLPEDIRKRELETHKKCRKIIRVLEELDVDKYFNWPVLTLLSGCLPQSFILKRRLVLLLLPRVLANGTSQSAYRLGRNLKEDQKGTLSRYWKCNSNENSIEEPFFGS